MKEHERKGLTAFALAAILIVLGIVMGQSIQGGLLTLAGVIIWLVFARRRDSDGP